MNRRTTTAALLLASAAIPAHAQQTYVYDDGVANIAFGPPTSFAQFGDIDMLWGNLFTTVDAAEEVVRVDFGIGDLSPGNTVTIGIWDDPNNDGDPTDGVPLLSLDVTAQPLGFARNEITVPPTRVEGNFFVGITHLCQLESPPGYPAPGRWDPDTSGANSWFFYDGDIPEANLAGAGFAQQMTAFGAVSVRAITQPATDCPCERDGQPGIGITDLLTYLQAWFSADPTADLDDDPVIDVRDLLEFLACWFDPGVCS